MENYWFDDTRKSFFQRAKLQKEFQQIFFDLLFRLKQDCKEISEVHIKRLSMVLSVGYLGKRVFSTQ